MHETAPWPRFDPHPPRFPDPRIALAKMDIGSPRIEMRTKAGIGMNAPAHPVACFQHHTTGPESKGGARSRNAGRARPDNHQIDIG